MVKEKKEESVEEKDLFDIFMDNGASQLQNQLLKSKRKLLNAKRGKNQLFDIVKLKLKGLDMLILVLENNKDIVKNENIYCLDTLAGLLKVARSEKNLFDSVVKKVKTVITLILKNQIFLNQEEKFEDLCKFMVEIMNLQFENSFLQQVVDKMKSNHKVFNIFVNLFFNKFFKGRNVTFKINDLKYMIKYTFSTVGPFYYLHKLLHFLHSKEKGGARTNHQINQVFGLMTYTIELTNNKLKDENVANATDFKKRFITLENENFTQFGVKIEELMEENGHHEKDDDETDQAKTHITKAKNSFFFIGLITFYEKFLSFLKKSGFQVDENLNHNISKVTDHLDKGVEKYDLKNMNKKMEEIKGKSKSLLNTFE